MTGPALARLAALREAGDPDLAALWIEALDPEEGHREVRGREGPVYRLQEARILVALGRREEAEALLDRLPDLPPGLAAARDGVRGAPPVRAIQAEAERSLEGWLARVRAWRRARGV